MAEEVDKRQSRILEQIKEQRSRMELEAEAEAQKQGKEWEAQGDFLLTFYIIV